MVGVIAGPSGGVGGVPFDDEPPAAGGRLRELRVWSGSAIDGLQIVLMIDGVLAERPRHGGSQGGYASVLLEPGEVITEIYGRYGSYLEQLSIRTNRGQSRRFGGVGGASEFAYFAPEGFQIAGFWGRAGRVIDALGVHLAPID